MAEYKKMVFENIRITNLDKKEKLEYVKYIEKHIVILKNSKLKKEIFMNRIHTFFSTTSEKRI